MPAKFNVRKGILPVLLALSGCLGVRSDFRPILLSRMTLLPPVTLWAWERREDMRDVDPHRYAIAYLDQTLSIELTVHSQPRRNPVAFSASAVRMPVVRIEAGRNAVLNDFNRGQAVDAILTRAREPGIAALQLDFDATQSQRAFYRSLLVDLRQRMPADLPLSITALASWCSWDGWLHGLPIDEAVPMFFRMEPDRRRAASSLEDFQIREPLCQGSIGVSTTERWPSERVGKRMYVFSDRGWQVDRLEAVERQIP